MSLIRYTLLQRWPVFFFLPGCHKTCPLSRTRSRLDKIETLLLSQKNSTMFTNNTRRCTCSVQILAKGRNSWFLGMRQNVSWVCFLHLKAKVHLFFLQDDFLLQHFDGVELVVRLVLGEQHLHEGLFVSDLFGKHSVVPLSRHSRRYNPKKKEKKGRAGNTDNWAVETDETMKSEKCVDTKRDVSSWCRVPAVEMQTTEEIHLRLFKSAFDMMLIRDVVFSTRLTD